MVNFSFKGLIVTKFPILVAFYRIDLALSLVSSLAVDLYYIHVDGVLPVIYVRHYDFLTV